LLRRAELREALLERLGGVERVVLLGDSIELRQGPLRSAFAAARPFFEALGARLGADGEVVVVSGNHDYALVEPWLARRRRFAAPPPLTLAEEGRWEPHDPFAEVAGWLAPARVRLAYPGVWLRDDVYATHGHYLDRHTTIPTFERLGAGVMGRFLGIAPRDGNDPDTYETVLAPLYAWSHAIAQHADEDAVGTQAASIRVWQTLVGDGHRPLRQRALAALFPLGVAAINRAGVGPVRADVSGRALSAAGVAAMIAAVEQLAIPAAHVIYGHTHRPGPLLHDDPQTWVAPSGARLVNTGSWVYQRHFVGDGPATSPYWPGTAVRVPADGPPELLRLLDDRGHDELASPPPTGTARVI
jgi:predicted phosphodiesterase